MTQDWVGISPNALLGRGLLAVVFGVLALARPGTTLLALVIVWGVWALMDGLVAVAHAFSSGTVWQRIGSVLLGLLGILAGLIAFVRPGMAVVTITWVLGVWLIARGIAEVIGVFSLTGGTRWLLLLAAALDLALGVLLFLNPGRGALSVLFAVGLLALAWGLVFIITSFMLRGGRSDKPAAEDSPSEI